MNTCYFCKVIPQLVSEKSPRIIHEFEHSYLISGDHQTFKGYCVLVYKKHVKELTDLSPNENHLFYTELMSSVAAIQKAFPSEKINLSNYGNMTPHQHWHIFPRIIEDSAWPKPPWVQMDSFDMNKTTNEDAIYLKETLQKYFDSN